MLCLRPRVATADFFKTMPLDIASQSQTSLSLSTIDRAIKYRGHISLVIGLPFLKFPCSDCSRTTFKQLERGLIRTLKQHPYLAGSLHFSEQGEIQNCIYDPDARLTDLGAVFQTASRPDLDWDSITRNGIPPDQMLPEWFSPCKLHHDNIRPLLVKATIIQAGLIIGICVSHSLADGTGVSNLMDCFATNVQIAFPPRPFFVRPFQFIYNWIRPSQPRCEHWYTSSNYTLSSLQNAAALELGEDPADRTKVINIKEMESRLRHNGLPTYQLVAGYKEPSTRASSCIFSFAPDRIKAIMMACRPHLNTEVTPFIILASLIWAATVKARVGISPHWDTKGQSMYCFTTEIRQALGLPSTYVGNAYTFSYAEHQVLQLCECDLSELMNDSASHTKSAKLVAELSQKLYAAALFTRARALEIVVAMSKAPQHSIGPGVDLTRGYNVYTNSWLALGSDANFAEKVAGTHSNKPSFIRKLGPSSNTVAGYNIILPRKGKGKIQGTGDFVPFEVLIGLEEEHMARLCDPGSGWMKLVVSSKRK